LPASQMGGGLPERRMEERQPPAGGKELLPRAQKKACSEKLQAFLLAGQERPWEL